MRTQFFLDARGIQISLPRLENYLRVVNVSGFDSFRSFFCFLLVIVARIRRSPRRRLLSGTEEWRFATPCETALIGS